MEELIKKGLAEIAIGSILGLVILYFIIRGAVIEALSKFFDTKEEILQRQESELKLKQLNESKKLSEEIEERISKI